MKLSLVLLVLSVGGLAAADSIIQDGLLLHLDATRSNLAGPVARWADKSGGPLIAIQPVATARPLFRSGETEAFVRFDGKDDFLHISGPVRAEKELTIFVLAAPRANPGPFSALFSTTTAGQNDYTSGLNLDLGPLGTAELSVLNVESAGAGGFRDLLQPAQNLASELPFGGFHLFTVRSQIGERGNELFMDGLRLGARARTESVIGLEEMVIGGRIYSNDPAQPPYAQGFFQGDIAAVLVYRRALSDEERAQVEQALFTRTPALNAMASGQRGHALESLTNAPPVQMLVPGFIVRELPLDLRNQNNLRYRPDGKVVALGYDGRIHLLSDSDGDGLEDTATVFWDKAPLRGPIGLALLPPGDPRGDGVYVASKAKVSLILDENRDGVADKEIVVAEGWKETPHGVDTLGVAVDPKDGAVYFSIGCENFANGYLLDAAGKPHFDLATERGTIQRVAPDLSGRTTICTGVRFGCALAFNAAGDLFVTDQEGATWLSNGNPLDELLHIVPGRHYGFPPRHPRHLPQVIDEPPVMEYSPQHQSTVGMVFNEGVNGGPSFGPAQWRGDALICGESRGKLYRTKLVKTPEGYVGQNQLIACLGLLTIDACVTPKGELLVACHSGPPDWGTGPTGNGKIFKISYANADLPQPVWAWASAPDQFRIAFDRPLRVEDWSGAKEKVRIEAGRYVSAGDRFEAIRPGYQVVRDQMGAPRRWIEVQSLTLTEDRRTILLRVPRQTERATYGITLPLSASWQLHKGIEQVPELDLALTLNGVEVGREIVLPHPSMAVAKALTEKSADHERFFQKVGQTDSRSQSLTVRGLVDISNIFVPVTQPGSQLDWDIGKDAFANQTMSLRLTQENKEVRPTLETDSRLGTFEIAGSDLRANRLVFALGERTRPIQTRRLFVPWAGKAVESNAIASARTDVKGRWLEGRRLFFSDAGCATCHTLRGEGISFGPDLSNLIHRDRESVVQDITRPGATINPDHIGTVVKFKDGTEMNGLVRLTEKNIVVRMPAGVEVERPREQVASLEPMNVSLMPENLEQLISRAQLEDLLTFLLTNPLEPAPISRLDPPTPAPRAKSEVASLLPPPGAQRGPSTPLRILLCTDTKDHGVDEHDYPLFLNRWTTLLSLAEGIAVTNSLGFPNKAQLDRADVTVFYSRNSGWDAKAAALLDEYQKRGGGLVYLHWGIEGGKEADALADRIGLSFSASRFRHGEMDLVFTGTEHPITRGLPNLHLTDESYWGLRGDPARVTVLASSKEDGEPRPQLWTMERNQGRVFCCIPGHYIWTMDDPLYRLMVLRGIAWTAKQENIDRLAELALVGTRIGQ